ncbi:sensor of ECF-type sigma factor [Flavobacterium sp. GT3R68]|uniref:sensor of ECF-type sigma factor n=1 Tax=Flavobacterium sp. GT3R68 TaxID=2594437 RepID=UPI000F86B3C6|nr:sensor of ECF-type sigma factor [Flavobacterium sp. GT3R68]RTY95181.1 sensor of ECF-type sigma factor [Flavobacterium sp. GSN2]TRW91076.1 sensor of ECF-type sigma factor [Flavobacterium sp. GT3R68]
MKLKNILLILLLLVSFSSFAQGGRMRGKKEQVKALKVAFLTNELSLSTAEAEKFWPVYNAFDDKQFELRHQKMRAYMDRMDDGSVEKMSEKEAATFLVQMENTEDELYQLRKKFVSNLKGILSPVKIIKLKKAEEDFNRKLLKQYRDKQPRR